MDEEGKRLEGVVSALELKVSELDEDDISVEEAAQLRSELDDTYEQIDVSDLADEAVESLMGRLDDLQDVLEDLVADPDWDDEQREEEEEEDDEESEEKGADDDE
jgi:hypothetical protein